MMRKITRLCLPLLSGLTFQALASSDLTLCYEAQDYQPFLKPIEQSSSRLLGERGMLPDMAILASQKLDISINFTTTSWKRCIELVRAGLVDGMFGAVYKPERESWAAYPEKDGTLDHERRLWTVDYRVYSNIHSPLQWDGENFSGITNGVDAPNAYFTYDQLNRIGVLPARNSLPEKGFHLLALNRLDGYVLEEFTAQHLIARLKLTNQITVHKAHFAHEDLFLVFSHQYVRKQPELSEALWSTLAQVRKQQGDTLLNRYLIP